MATSKNCSACNDLQKYAPEFITNGVTDKVCNSLKNNTGFSTSNGRDNCTDISDANDCLIGNLADEIDGYDNCDWKSYLRRLVPNIYNVLSAITCWLCGVQKKVDKVECQNQFLANGVSFKIGESPTDGSYVVAGKGISFLQPHEGEPYTTDIGLTYIAGGLMMGIGTLRWYQSDFTDEGAVANFDNGSVERTTKARKGNPIFSETGRPATGGELLYEIRLKRSQYPQIKQLFNGVGQETGGGAYHVYTAMFREGTYAYGNHGWCNEETGAPTGPNHDSGHKVPEGWTYIQVRLTYADMPFTNGEQYTPRYYMGVRMNLDAANC